MCNGSLFTVEIILPRAGSNQRLLDQWASAALPGLLDFNETLLFELERRTDRLGARSVQLWIRSAEFPGEHRYEKWTKNTDLK